MVTAKHNPVVMAILPDCDTSVVQEDLVHLTHNRFVHQMQFEQVSCGCSHPTGVRVGLQAPEYGRFEAVIT